MSNSAFKKQLLEEGFGIIPNSVLFAQSLQPFDKLLFCYISCLCAEKGYCFAGNEYLSEKMNASVRYIQKSLSKLKAKNFIRIQIVNNCQREIYLNEFFK